MKKYLKYIIIALVVICLGVLLWNNTETKNESENEMLCTITVECSDILNDINSLKEEKHLLVPKNGIIYTSSDVVFTDGETAFDVLKKKLKDENIPLDFSITPAYNSAYIKGINNIYEQDCGERSGWTYLVNGESPSVASSDYKLKDGDEITFTYKIKAY